MVAGLTCFQPERPQVKVWNEHDQNAADSSQPTLQRERIYFDRAAGMATLYALCTMLRLARACNACAAPCEDCVTLVTQSAVKRKGGIQWGGSQHEEYLTPVSKQDKGVACSHTLLLPPAMAFSVSCMNMKRLPRDKIRLREKVFVSTPSTGSRMCQTQSLGRISPNVDLVLFPVIVFWSSNHGDWSTTNCLTTAER